MAKLPSLTARKVLRALKRAGFVEDRQKVGDGMRTYTVPVPFTQELAGKLIAWEFYPVWFTESGWRAAIESIRVE
jgi:predicted RNA binding protein YcfA (HicA-like mRNA interferase family)